MTLGNWSLRAQVVALNYNGTIIGYLVEYYCYLGGRRRRKVGPRRRERRPHTYKQIQKEENRKTYLLALTRLLLLLPLLLLCWCRYYDWCWSILFVFVLFLVLFLLLIVGPFHSEKEEDVFNNRPYVGKEKVSTLTVLNSLKMRGAT